MVLRCFLRGAPSAMTDHGPGFFQTRPDNFCHADSGLYVISSVSPRGLAFGKLKVGDVVQAIDGGMHWKTAHTKILMDSFQAHLRF